MYQQGKLAHRAESMREEYKDIDAPCKKSCKYEYDHMLDVIAVEH